MSSANGNNITESFNSIRGDDDLCVSCGKHGCASKSNLCKVCQKAMGIKKISARRLAQLGWTAEESFEASSGFEYSYYERNKAYRAWRKNYEASGILQDRATWSKIHDLHEKYESQGYSYGECVVKLLKEMGLYNQLMDGVNVDAFIDHNKHKKLYRAESFGAEESSKGLPWMTFALIGLGAFVASRIKTVNFKAHDDCGCGCSGAGGCGDEKKADEGHYPNTYDPVQDFLPRYRYPEDSDWSNSYNPTDPYRPLDYQTVQTDTRVTADRM